MRVLCSSRGGHGHVLVPEPQLPVLQLYEPCQRERPGQPLGRAAHALHVQLLRVHDHRLPRLQPVDADGPVLRVLGVLAPDDDLRERDLGAAFERDHGLAMLLQLQQPCGRQRHHMSQQQDGLHVLPHRHREHAGIRHGCVILIMFQLQSMPLRPRGNSIVLRRGLQAE